jgi:hypothetical protein
MCDEPEEEDAEAGMWAPRFTYDTERQDGPDGPPPLPEDWLRPTEANTSQITRDPPGLGGAVNAVAYEEWMKKKCTGGSEELA